MKTPETLPNSSFVSHDHSEKVAIVTGAAGGIGSSIAEALCEAGFEVALLDVQEAALDRAVGMLTGRGLRAVGIRIDLANDDEIARLPECLGSRFQRVAVLVNNAGVSPKHEGFRLPTESIPLAEWDVVMKVNITAPFRLCQLVLPVMQQNRWGRIVNVSSRGARSPGGVAGIHYVTSKAGMLGFTRSLARDYAKFGITANAIAPGRIASPMTDGSALEVQARMGSAIPLGRFGRPEEIGALVAFLAGDGAGYITGATIDINGGVLMI